MVFESPPISPKTPASAVKCKTPREKGPACQSSFLSNYFQKKPKTSPTKEPCSRGSFTQSGGEKESSGSRCSKKADLHSSSSLLVVKEEPTNAVEGNFQLLKSPNQEDTACNCHTPAPEVAHSSSPPKDTKPIIKGETLLSLDQSEAGTRYDAFWAAILLRLAVTWHLSYPSRRVRNRASIAHGPQQNRKSETWSFDDKSEVIIATFALMCPFAVECPVCSVSVPQHFINKHLDTCLSRGEKKESLRR